MKNFNLKKLIATAILASVITTSGAGLVGRDMTTVSAAVMSGTVTVTTGSLWTYNKADWNARAQVVNRGEAFNIAEKISVAGKEMYGLTNGLYITANSAYISAQEVAASKRFKTATDNLNMRTGNSTAYSVILTIPKGTKVEVLQTVNGWDQVIYNGKTGWASAQYLSTSAAPAPTPTPSPVTVYKTAVYNLNMRSGNTTGHSIILTIPQGTKVPVLSSSNGWDQVSYNGKTGWASAQYLSTSAAPAPTPTPTPTPTPPPAPAPTVNSKFRTTTSNLNMRSGNTTGHSVILTIPKGSRVEVVSSSNGWDQVIYNGKTGWASATYMSVASSKVTGEDIVNYAKTFLGIRYTWGGNTPAEGFDCSGLIKYVFAHYGHSTPRVSRDQAKHGAAVSMDALQPGDLVYFGNGTVSHIGIYVGGNQMLHAPQPGKNVEIKDMTWHLNNYSTVGARRYMN